MHRFSCRKPKLVVVGKIEATGLGERESRTSSDTKLSLRRLRDGSFQGRLCQRRKAIDFQAIFVTSKRISSQYGVPVLALGNLEATTSDCSVCRLFAALGFPTAQLVQFEKILSTIVLWHLNPGREEDKKIVSL
jgi:hypothetical protein